MRDQEHAGTFSDRGGVLPNTPVGRQVVAYLAAFNTGDRASMERYLHANTASNVWDLPAVGNQVWDCAVTH